MTVFNKKPNNAIPLHTSTTVTPVVPVTTVPPVQPVNAGPGYRIQAQRVVRDTETLIKSKGAFKMKVENKGQVGITVFGAVQIPTYSEQTFETGDPSLAFQDDTHIEYDPHNPADTINLIVTLYFK
jgi:hypothetical protein